MTSTQDQPSASSPPAGLAADIRQLQDEIELRNIIARFCRGADRFDRELMLSCFHEGAVDDHGPSGTFLPASQMIDNALSKVDLFDGLVVQHVMGNTLFDIDGDTAFGEAYISIQVGVLEGEREGFTSGIGAFGRYIDRFERRDGRWGIVRRITAIEWAGGIPWPLEPKPGARDRSDWSYER